jgi:hypothetical protein
MELESAGIPSEGEIFLAMRAMIGLAVGGEVEEKLFRDEWEDLPRREISERTSRKLGKMIEWELERISCRS